MESLLGLQKRYMCVDLGTHNKIKELCVTQGKETVYTYCNEEITVHKFKPVSYTHLRAHET